jgi:hypothetical protein
LCTISVQVQIRYQATLTYARRHPEQLGRLNEHIRKSHETLILDLVEQEMQRMEWNTQWMEQGCAALEKNLQREINETLAVHHIRCRTHCRIEAAFAESLPGEQQFNLPWARHRNLYLSLRERQAQAEAERRAAEEALHQERHQQHLQELARKAELEAQQDELRKRSKEREQELIRMELAEQERLAQMDRERELRELAEREAFLRESLEHEAREREAQIFQEAHLRKLEHEADQEEKNLRAQSHDTMDQQLRKEIELLSMERQRLLLEEEVREIKLAKAKGWIINARNRFPLGGNRREIAETTDIPQPEDHL